MPNQNVQTQYYFTQNNFDDAQMCRNRIVEAHGLASRQDVNDYGVFKTAEDYSEYFLSWSNLADDFLLQKKAHRNPMYNLWSGMRNRCYDPNCISYAYYGGRGIEMDPEWKDNFEGFAQTILGNLGRKPEGFFSINRKDNNANYTLENLEWSSPIKQSRNRSNTKISERSALCLAMLYKYYRTTGRQLKDIYNSELAESPSHQITKGWGGIYNACRSYCQLV